MTRALNALRGQTYVWIKTLNPEIFWRYKSYIRSNPWLHEHIRFISYLNLFRLIIVFGFFHKNGSAMENINIQNPKPHVGSESKYCEKSKLRTYAKSLIESDGVIIDVAKVALIFDDDKPQLSSKVFQNPYISLLCHILWQNNTKIIFHNNTDLNDAHILKLLKKHGYSNIHIPKDSLLDPELDFAYISSSPSSSWSKKEPIQPKLKYYMDPILSGKRFRAGYKSPLYKAAGFVQNLYLHNGIGDFSSSYEAGFLYHSMPLLGICTELYKEYKNGNYAYIEFDQWSEEYVKPYFITLFQYKPEPINAERRCLEFSSSRARQLIDSALRRLKEIYSTKNIEGAKAFLELMELPSDLEDFLLQLSTEKTAYKDICSEDKENPIGKYIIAGEIRLGINEFFKELGKSYDSSLYLNTEYADIQKDLFTLLDHILAGDFIFRYISQIENTKSIAKSGPMEI